MNISMDLNIDLDPSSPVPLYIQIVEKVRRLLALGALRPDDRLPTVRDLAVHLRINRNTAARAIRQLEREGLVRTRVGQGTFVQEFEPKVEPGERKRSMEQALDRLLVEAHSLGVSPMELGDLLEERVEELRADAGEVRNTGGIDAEGDSE